MKHAFGTLKSEWLDDESHGSREKAKQDVLHFIEMEYNSDRGHSSLG